MSKLRLFFIGLLMGMADLIPGISGGSVAFICGIYEELLTSIKSLQFHSMKNIAWPFILPLGGGILVSVLLFSKVLYFLMLMYQSYLFALFFGCIAGSFCTFFKKMGALSLMHLVGLIAGGLFSYTLVALLPRSECAYGSISVFCIGTCAGCAMLLPGISGSYLLQIVGIYQLVLHALSYPLAPGSLQILLSLGLGVAFGMMLFSRLVDFCLEQYHRLTVAVLVGLMGGGLKGLWPIERGNACIPLILIALGFCCFLVLEKFFLKTKPQPTSSS